MVDLDLKQIVHELGDVAWCEGKNFEDWVEPRINAILQALDERDALKAEIDRLPAKWSEDSSLKTWFPITNDQLNNLQQENVLHKAFLKASRQPGPICWIEINDLPKLEKGKGATVYGAAEGQLFSTHHYAPLYRAPTKPLHNTVKLPTNADEAAAMHMVGLAWLEHNAPDRLKAPLLKWPEQGGKP